MAYSIVTNDKGQTKLDSTTKTEKLENYRVIWEESNPGKEFDPE